ncbi:hypothetical protein KII05_11250, partial [Weissella confusa]|uniref:hypothetical protein n=1 Tax=Weissella confusa TaxID=1583 RepID=UPI001BCA7C63
RQQKQDLKEERIKQKNLQEQAKQSYLKKRDRENLRIQKQRLKWDKERYNEFQNRRKEKEYQEWYDITEKVEKLDTPVWGKNYDKNQKYLNHKKKAFKKRFGSNFESYRDNVD